MMPSLFDQAQNSDKNTEAKYPKCDELFLGYSFGYLLIFSMIEKKIVYQFGRIFSSNVISMAKTSDNKT